jgi:hypothetical protein
MFCRQLCNPCSTGKQHSARQDNNCGHAFSGDRRKRAVEFAAAARFRNLKLHAQRPRGNFGSLQLDRDAWLAGVAKDGDTPNSWGELLEKLQALPPDLRRRHPQPGDVAARPREAGNKPIGNWVAHESHDNGNRPGRLLRRLHARQRCRDDDVDLELHQFSGQVGESFELPASPAPFDADVLTLDVPQLA